MNGRQARRSERPPFNMPTAEFWNERAKDPSSHLYQRVAFAAFARHRRNGHARLQRGELRKALAINGVEPPAKRVSEAIRDAVEHGWLQESSCAACLVVPPSVGGGPMGGDPLDPCSYHDQDQPP